MRTEVVLFERADGMLTGFQASGHSGYAEAGNDIVCAGISALTQSVANGVMNILKAPCMFEQDDEDGFLEVRLTPEATQEQVERSQLLWQTLAEGLEAIRAAYPRHIRILRKRR